MDGETILGGEATGEQNIVAPAPAATTGEASAPTVSAALTDGAGTAEPSAPAEDWRTRMAAGDDKELARLKRFASEENFYKSYRELERRFKAAPVVPTLPEGATPEQLAEYRKAVGVPETPDGYGIDFSREFQATEADKAMLQGWLQHANATNQPPAVAKEAVAFVEQWTTRQREEQAAALQREFGQTKRELRQEYGADYLRNSKLLDEWLEDKPSLDAIIRANIHKKGVLQESIKLALAMAPEDALYSGDGGAGGKSLDDRISELRDLKLSGKASPSQITEYDKLYETKFARDERRANGRR